jgi:ribosome-associated translation inhibitor RaiA
MPATQITFHGLDASQPLTELIERRAQLLDRFTDRLQTLRVLVDAPHHHHRHGNHYRVRLELVLPGEDLVVERDDAGDGEDPYLTVRRAFDGLRRRLTAKQERRHGRQRAHAAGPGSARR